ncbi:MAG: hypothetical protein HC838_14550 [Spirulinaceae cyanobacterium RM2_2_10]|nr:hypothetical protein [Spirulinaceae cyanobacterium RM2_2_10]
MAWLDALLASPALSELDTDQRAVLRDDRQNRLDAADKMEYAEPYYWAAFALTGAA